MTAQPVEDGALQPAVNAFVDAVADLVEEVMSMAGSRDCPDCHNEDCEPDCETHTCPGHLTPTDSLYVQLYDAVNEGRTGGSHSTSRPRSLPTGWIDAQQILDEIDTGIGFWQPTPVDAEDLTTPARLRAMAKRTYRPQDVKELEQKTDILKAWCKDIRELFDPTPKWHLPNPCPSCAVAVVYRNDSGGDRVRQPALQIGPDGCQCQNCRTVWAPDKFVFLARVLGSLPENVLE